MMIFWSLLDEGKCKVQLQNEISNTHSSIVCLAWKFNKLWVSCYRDNLCIILCRWNFVTSKPHTTAMWIPIHVCLVNVGPRPRLPGHVLPRVPMVSAGASMRQWRRENSTATYPLRLGEILLLTFLEQNIPQLNKTFVNIYCIYIIMKKIWFTAYIWLWHLVTSHCAI